MRESHCQRLYPYFIKSGGNSRPPHESAIMKIKYQNITVPTAEVWKQIQDALNLIEGKHGFRTSFEIWHNCEMMITIGHNINTVSIIIQPPELAVIRRRSNWRNSYAYYRNGAFYGNVSNTIVKLI